MNLEDKVDIIIMGGYTVMPEDVLRTALQSLNNSDGEDYLIGQDKARRLFEEKPCIYYSLKAAMATEKGDTITVLGSKELGNEIDQLVGLVIQDLDNEGKEYKKKEVMFAEMFYADESILDSCSKTKRMDIEQKSVHENLKRAFQRSGYRKKKVVIGCDTPKITSEMIDDVAETFLKSEAKMLYPLIAKETLTRMGRLKRSFMNIVNDKFGSGTYNTDIYGRIKLKESNCLCLESGMPDEVFEYIGNLYSIRKMNNVHSIFKGIGILAPEVKTNGNDRNMKKGLQKLVSLDKGLKVLHRYINGSLRISYMEKIANNILNTLNGTSGEKLFEFFEMNHPEFSFDIDSVQDLSFEKDASLIVDISDIIKNPEIYFGKNVFLKGKPDKIVYRNEQVIREKKYLQNIFFSVFGYKQLNLQINNGSAKMNAYRFKYFNPINNFFQHLSDRIFIDDITENIDVDSRVEQISLVNQFPSLKYENLVKDLSYNQKKGNEIYLVGKYSPLGVWIHGIILEDRKKTGSLKKYLFRHRCPDKRCVLEKPSYIKTLSQNSARLF